MPNHTPHLRFHKNHGFSTLEILIACTLGIMLITGICQVYLSAKKSYMQQANLADLQENVRFATLVLTQNIRMAGYAGCAKLDDLQKNNNYIEHAVAKLGFSKTNSLHGFNSDNLPSYLQGTALSGSDVLVIQKADADQTRLLNPQVTRLSNTFKAYQNPATHNNPYLLIASCESAELFKAKEVGGIQITLAKDNLQYDYSRNDTIIGRFTEIAYFISQSGRKDTTGKDINNLYMMTNQGNKEEVLSGVDTMKISYGIKHNNKIVYFTAKEISAWQDVCAVRIILNLTAPQKLKKMLDLEIDIAPRE